MSCIEFVSRSCWLYTKNIAASFVPTTGVDDNVQPQPCILFPFQQSQSTATVWNNGSLHEVPAVNPVLTHGRGTNPETGRSSQGAWAARLRKGAACDPGSLQSDPRLGTFACEETKIEGPVSSHSHSSRNLWPAACSVLYQLALEGFLLMPAVRRRGSKWLNGRPHTNQPVSIWSSPWPALAIGHAGLKQLGCPQPHRELKASVGHLRPCLKN